MLFDKEQFSPTCKLFVRQRNINPETKYHVQLLGGASILSPWGFWEESKLNFSYFRTICISPLTCGINFECLKCNYKYSMVGDIPILKYIFTVYRIHISRNVSHVGRILGRNYSPDDGDCLQQTADR